MNMIGDVSTRYFFVFVSILFFFSFRYVYTKRHHSVVVSWVSTVPFREMRQGQTSFRIEFSKPESVKGPSFRGFTVPIFRKICNIRLFFLVLKTCSDYLVNYHNRIEYRTKSCSFLQPSHDVLSVPNINNFNRLDYTSSRDKMSIEVQNQVNRVQ